MHDLEISKTGLNILWRGSKGSLIKLVNSWSYRDAII